jgi:hypothetical protein
MVVKQSGEVVSQARYTMERPLKPRGAAPGVRLLRHTTTAELASCLYGMRTYNATVTEQ